MFKMGIKFNFNSYYQLRELLVCCIILSRAFSLLLASVCIHVRTLYPIRVLVLIV